MNKLHFPNRFCVQWVCSVAKSETEEMKENKQMSGTAAVF